MSHVRPDTATRTGAVLFTDLVGFTEFTDVRGDRAAVEVLDRQSSLVHDELAGQGRIVKELGDGLMLWFGDARVGLTVACNILASVSAARDRNEFPLAVRMGMHVGEVIERGADFVGRTVNIASRVADLAGPGELLVTEQVVRSLEGNGETAAFRPVGPTRVKGVSAPIWLHRLAT